MKLAINNNGAWKILIDFPAGNLAVVRSAVAALVKASDSSRASFKISDDAGARFYLDAPNPEWREAKC